MTIDAYLEDLRRRLPGPRGPRRDLLRELGDGLRDAASIHQTRGLPREEAERRAVSESGAPEELAPRYSETLAVIQGRRTATLYALSTPASVFAWSVVWSTPGAVPSQVAAQQSPVAMLCWRLIDYAGIATGVAAVAALGMLVLSHRLGWSSRAVVLLPAVVGFVNVAVTAVCSTIGNLIVDGGSFVPGRPLPPTLGMLAVASSAVICWQCVSSWHTIRRVRAAGATGSGSPPGAHPAAA